MPQLIVTPEESMFEVREVPIPYLNIGNNRVNSGYKMIINVKQDKVLSVVTDKYNLIKNEDVFNSIKERADKVGATLTQVSMSANGSKVSYTFTMLNMLIEVKGYQVHPRIVISNSYDKTASLTILAGAFILVCSNGMIIGETTSSVKYKHVENSAKLDLLPNAFDNAINDISEYLQNKIIKMINRKITSQTSIMKFIEIFKNGAYQEKAADMISSERPETYWDLLQIATNILTHHANRESDYVKELESRIYNLVSKV